jgi:hypothetical protein
MLWWAAGVIALLATAMFVWLHRKTAPSPTPAPLDASE